MAKKAKRHVLAKTSIEVFRLFKVRDLAMAVRVSNDPVVAALGSQMAEQCHSMLKPYTEQQIKLAQPAAKRLEKQFFKKRRAERNRA